MAWLHTLVAFIVLSSLPSASDCLQKLSTKEVENAKVSHHDEINLIDLKSKIFRERERSRQGRYDTRNNDFPDKTFDGESEGEISFVPNKLVRNGNEQTLKRTITYRKKDMKRLPMAKYLSSRLISHYKKTMYINDSGRVSETNVQGSQAKGTNKGGRNDVFNRSEVKTGRRVVTRRQQLHRIKRDALSTKATPRAGLGSTPSILPSLLAATTEMPHLQGNTKIGMAPVQPRTTGPFDADGSGHESTVLKTPMDPNFRVDGEMPNFGTDRGLNSSNDKPDTEPEPWPEPGPDWSSAYMYLGVAWFIHIYGFASVMFFIAILATITLVDMAGSETLTSRGLSTSLNCLLLLFGYTRGVSLVLNPYGSLERISLLASRLLWSVGFPCLTSMLTTLLLVLVDTTKVSLGPPKFQQFHVVMKLSVTHFILVLGTDVILSFYLRLKALLLVCQLIYITWSVLLTVGYYRVGYLISRNFTASRGTKIINDSGSQRLERLIFACGTVALCNCITHLYGAAGVFGVYSDLTYVPAWPWWVFQTLMRLEEIGMCLIVLTLAGKSRRECNMNTEGKKGLICACWLKLKSLIVSKREKKATHFEPEDEERRQGEVAAAESWNSYGTNASANNSSPRSFELQARKQTRTITEENIDNAE